MATSLWGALLGVHEVCLGTLGETEHNGIILIEYDRTVDAIYIIYVFKSRRVCAALLLIGDSSQNMLTYMTVLVTSRFRKRGSRGYDTPPPTVAFLSAYFAVYFQPHRDLVALNPSDPKNGRTPACSVTLLVMEMLFTQITKKAQHSRH